MPSRRHHVRRRREADLLQQTLDDLRRDRIGHVGEELHLRRRGPRVAPEPLRRAEALWQDDRHRQVRALGRALRRWPGRARPRCPSLVAASSAPAARLRPPAPRRASSSTRDSSSSTTATVMRRVAESRWLPNTDAKIEKKMIGRRNVSACDDAIASEVDPADAQQRAEDSIDLLAELPPGEGNEHVLQRRARASRRRRPPRRAPSTAPASSGATSRADVLDLRRQRRRLSSMTKSPAARPRGPAAAAAAPTSHASAPRRASSCTQLVERAGRDDRCRGR